MITEEDFLLDADEEDAEYYGPGTKPRPGRPSPMCPICEKRDRAHKQPYCTRCWHLMLTRHRSRRAFLNALGFDPFEDCCLL